MNLEYIASIDDKNRIIKDILINKMKISHRLLITLKKENCIFLNDIPSNIYKNVQPNDKVTISFGYEEDNSNIFSKNIPLNIIYEDDWYIIVDKPYGIPVHPSINHYKDSLSSGIKFYFDSISLKKKIRPVNRIDKDTSRISYFRKK